MVVCVTRFLYEDEESMSLVIKDVEKADAGTYRVSAENELGEDSAELTLKVKGTFMKHFKARGTNFYNSNQPHQKLRTNQNQ